jgi:hypothetical protein
VAARQQWRPMVGVVAVLVAMGWLTATLASTTGSRATGPSVPRSDTSGPSLASGHDNSSPTAPARGDSALVVRTQPFPASRTRSLTGHGLQPKLSVKQQTELRRMHATGDYSITELFTIGRATVYRTLQRAAPPREKTK